ncbi:type 1 glutamine amidotransferase domain-containing protein [Massilia terrae]|uniref:Type 1 glutamine amidotransferase domain-containing protein n=1 Tax=Massilia terrae TaxID=1811224 RepID=A0ABT2CYY0_9BURK|nr:type 1 glutamine amidotransferase domain-containing protein [Massilia terrae]MCS0659193.1 type 1 glutamine amidotransferase domain-containing protein [Massilia terrae]
MITKIGKWLYLGIFLASFGPLTPGAASGKEEVPRPKAKKVLIVMTNHSKYPTRSDTTGLWLTELTHFYEVFRDAGIDLDFVSPNGGPVPLDQRSLGRLYMDEGARSLLKDPQFSARLQETLSPSQVDASNYMAIFYTGGHGTMWDFRGNGELKTLAEQIYRDGGVVASVCHGAAGLLDLDGDNGRPLIVGKKITGFSNSEEYLSGVQNQVPFSLQDELKSRGAAYQKAVIPFVSYVVTDGRIVTGQNPGSSSEVAKETLRVIASQHSID